MTANQILISVIGLFFLITGLMYVFHLKKKEDAEKREWTVSWVLVGFGVLMMLIPFLYQIEFSSRNGKVINESELLGEDAFEGGSLPKITGSYDEAKAAYEKATSLYNYEKKGFDSAEVVLDYLNKSIELYETSEALTARGQLKVQQAKMQQAMPDYDRAIELNPDFGNAYFNRAGLYYILGDVQSACSDWKAAMELGVPNTEEVYNSFCN